MRQKLNTLSKKVSYDFSAGHHKNLVMFFLVVAVESTRQGQNWVGSSPLVFISRNNNSVAQLEVSPPTLISYTTRPKYTYRMPLIQEGV